MAAPDLDDLPTSEPSPRRPAGPLRSSTFGELPPQATQQAGNMSPQQESRREEIAPDKLELDFNAGTVVAVAVAVSVVAVLTFIILGVYTCASLRRRLGSIGSNNNNNNKDNNVGVTAGSRHHDVEVQAHANAPQVEQLLHEEDKEQWSAHKEGEWWPLGEEREQDGDEYEDEDEDEDEDEAGHRGRGEARAAETGTARVAHVVARGAVSMVDIRRRTPPSLLPSSRTVRDISSLPDLAWAQSLTTGGGRAVASAASAADLVGSGVVAAGASSGEPDGAIKKETASSSSPSSSSSKRKGFRKMVGRKNKVKEWCERGMGMGLGTGGFGPYAGMY